MFGGRIARKCLHISVFVILLSTVIVGPVFAAQVFIEGFGDTALNTDGTAITTSNSGFTYTRIGSGGGAIESNNPSTLGGFPAPSSQPRLNGRNHEAFPFN